MNDDADTGRDRLEAVARREVDRERFATENPEPSLGARLGQIGILGWMMVIPTLTGLWIGQSLDHTLRTGIMLSAAMLLLGVVLGFWLIWRWMQKQ